MLPEKKIIIKWGLDLILQVQNKSDMVPYNTETIIIDWNILRTRIYCWVKSSLICCSDLKFAEYYNSVFFLNDQYWLSVVFIHKTQQKHNLNSWLLILLTTIESVFWSLSHMHCTLNKNDNHAPGIL